MTKCIACGFSQNQSNAKYCAKCGSRLTFLAAGDVLQQRYKIVNVLGEGGMGAVCLAEDLQTFGNKCVVKEMTYYFDPTDPDEVEKARERFEDEARTLAQLSHPAIPDVRDYFSEAGRNYIVMEYVEGENLEARLAKENKPLPLEEVVQYGIRVCRILGYLNAQNPAVVHHDIKPANVVVSQDADSTSLVDFGTAKVRFVQAGGQLGQSQSSVYGTLGYAPPEQFGENPETGPRSDVYALGATMYELLTNDNPSDHPMDFPKLSTLPENIRQVLKGALENDVNQRITAEEMHAGLKRVLADIQASDTAPPPASDELPTPRKRIGGRLRGLVSLGTMLIMGSLLSWLGSGLIGQAAVYSIDQELAVPLIGLGILLALIAAVLTGSGLGGAGGFSKLGFLGGLIVSIPIISYGFLSMLAQFCSLRQVAGEPAAYVGLATIALVPFLLLLTFRYLRKANRRVLAFVTPLLLIGALVWWSAESREVWLETTTFYWRGDALPLAYFDSGIPGPAVYLRRGRDVIVPYIAVSGASTHDLAMAVQPLASDLAGDVPYVWRDLLFPTSEPRPQFTSFGSSLAVREQNCTCPCPFQ